jgi:large subunit ribosomal protein L17
MRHRSGTKRFNRTPSHRRAMLRNMASSLLKTDFDAEDAVPGPGRIVTTPQKAKVCRRFVEKLITLGKKGGVANLRRAISLLGDKEMARKIFNDIAPRYTNREGGYTRILHLAEVRLGDAAPQCIFELVEEEIQKKKPRAKKAPAKTRKKKAAVEAEEKAVDDTPEEDASAEETEDAPQDPDAQEAGK